VKAPVSSILGLSRSEPETVKESQPELPQYTEALGRAGCSTAQRRKAGLPQQPFKSANTLTIDSPI